MGNLLLLFSLAYADTATVRKIAVINGYNPNKHVMESISRAARAYNVSVEKMTAIAIVETGLGRYTAVKLNKNGTRDKGLFQINEVNKTFCREFNLNTDEGSAFCAAKILADLKKRYPKDYYGVYHSKTPKYKEAYKEKVDNILKKSKINMGGMK